MSAEAGPQHRMGVGKDPVDAAMGSGSLVCRSSDSLDDTYGNI